MTNNIHPTASIDSRAVLGENIIIGPYCVVGEHVKLGNHSVLKSHVVIEGRTDLGESNTVYPFAVLGTAPQDKKYHGEPSKLVIGSHNVIREHVTMNLGTEGGTMVTAVGNHGLFMVGAHIAHDCIVGDHVILANNATLAGHVQVGDYAIIGGLSAIHQFVRIGHYAMIGGMSGIEHDVIPYGQAMGERANLTGLNLIGLKRRGFEREDINLLRQAYKEVFLSAAGNLSDRISTAQQTFKSHPHVLDMLDFLKQESSRSICLPKNTGSGNHHDSQ